MIGFEQPALLLGAGAAAIPIAVHLFMRPRPRRVRFPPVALLHDLIRSEQRARRLRHRALLACRVALLGLLALLLARPTCRAAAHDTARPLTICVLDDSISQEYPAADQPGETRLSRSAAALVRLARGARNASDGSSVLVLLASRPDRVHASSADGDFEARLDVLLAARSRHARPLGDVLRAAGRQIAEARSSSAQVVVFTDGALSAWRNVHPGILPAEPPTALHLLVPDAAEPRNLGIAVVGLGRWWGGAEVSSAQDAGWKPVPQATIPETRQLEVPVLLRAAGLSAQGTLTVTGPEGGVLAEAGPLRAEPNAPRIEALALPPLAAGVHVATVRLSPEDLFDPDQRAYLAWQTGSLPTVWVIAADMHAAQSSPTVIILRNLLAPALMPADLQWVQADVLDPSSAETALAEAVRPGQRMPVLIVMTSGTAVSPEVVAALRAIVERGAMLLLVPDAAGVGADWPELRVLISEAAPVLEPAETSLRDDALPSPFERHGSAASGASRVAQRVRLSPLRTGAEVLARFVDGEPALVGRPLGRGRVLALATSPDPAWSELGVRAVGLMAWLHGLVAEGTGPATAAAMFTAGQTSEHVFASLPETGLVQVTRMGEPDAEPAWIRLAGGRPQPPWPTDEAGLYVIRGGGGQAARYAVNWPTEEFDLTRVTEEALQRITGLPSVSISVQGAVISQPGRRSGQVWLSDPVWWVGAVLLGAVLLETLLTGAARRDASLSRGQ